MMPLDQQERAFIYSWFSSLLSQELTKSQLIAYQIGTFDSLLDFLAEQGFEHHIVQLRQALYEVNQLDFPHLELAADFSQLFLLDGKISALPYASAYLSEEQLAQHLNEMDNLLSDLNLQINKAKNEPSDHLCVYLEILIRLIEQADMQKQKDFIKRQLLPWVTLFAQKLAIIKSQTQFYQNLIAFFVLFMEKDKD